MISSDESHDESITHALIAVNNRVSRRGEGLCASALLWAPGCRRRLGAGRAKGAGQAAARRGRRGGAGGRVAQAARHRLLTARTHWREHGRRSADLPRAAGAPLSSAPLPARAASWGEGGVRWARAAQAGGGEADCAGVQAPSPESEDAPPPASEDARRWAPLKAI